MEGQLAWPGAPESDSQQGWPRTEPAGRGHRVTKLSLIKMQTQDTGAHKPKRKELQGES